MSIPKAVHHILWLAVVFGLSACDAPKPSAQPGPSPTQASPGPDAPAPNDTRPSATDPEPTEVGVISEDAVNLDAGDEENRLIKSEVLTRIDTMPGLSDDDKDRLYVQVERARGMGKLLTIPFPSGAKAPSSADIGSIKASLALPQFQAYLEDPTVVFVVLGFADKKGDADANLVLSRSRADAVVTAMKERCGILNVTHAVGMGSSEFFDSANLDKNRVVEVWAVLP